MAPSQPQLHERRSSAICAGGVTTPNCHMFLSPDGAARKPLRREGWPKASRITTAPLEGEFFGGHSKAGRSKATIDLAPSTLLERIRSLYGHLMSSTAALEQQSHSTLHPRTIVNLRRLRDSGLLSLQAEQNIGDGEDDRADGGHCCVIADSLRIRSLRFATPQTHGAHLLQRGQILRREIFGVSGGDVRP
ncbi:hypothetical protein ACVWY3_000344 [Bradyrhizobium sp. USDA 4486]